MLRTALFALTLGFFFLCLEARACEEGLWLSKANAALAPIEKSQVPIVDRSFLPEVLALLRAEGCTEAVFQASLFRKASHFLQPFVLIKIMGIKGDEKFLISFAFKARSFFGVSTLSEVYDARGPVARELFADAATVMSRDANNTMTIKMMASNETPALSDEDVKRLREKVRSLAP
jgi:hypothetical protein